MTLTAIVVILVATVLGGISGGVGGQAGLYMVERARDRRLKREFQAEREAASAEPLMILPCKCDDHIPAILTPPRDHEYYVPFNSGRECACHPAWQCRTHGECRACACGCDTTSY